MFKKSDSYYGIELNENRYVFLIDISGSMENRAEKDLQGRIISKTVDKVTDKITDKVGGGEIVGMVNKQIQKQLTKLEKAKKKIIPVINGFTEDDYFTIIVFENELGFWKNDLVQATKANKKKAVLYVKALKAEGGTNISDALEKAFDLAGDGTKDNAKNLNVETIFLLTDGEPTAGKITNPDEIIEAVSEWNKLKRVKIHTIGLGENHDKNFMRKLAEQNNGVYIDK
ncbi:MAG: hypothetical protein Kow0068_24410 [Marinilabiliales bacterium]